MFNNHHNNWLARCPPCPLHIRGGATVDVASVSLFAARTRLRHGHRVVADRLVLQRHHIARDALLVCVVRRHSVGAAVDDLRQLVEHAELHYAEVPEVGERQLGQPDPIHERAEQYRYGLP